MPQIYGIEHILYLLVVFSLYAIGFVLIKKYIKTDKQIRLLIKGLGLLLFISIIWNRISVSILRDGWAFFIPSTFCGFSSLALSIGTMFLKKDHPFFHSVAYVGLLGGLLTTFYPDFIGQSDSIFYPMTISGLWHHSVMVFLVIVMIQVKFIVPSKVKWIYLPIGLSFYMTFGLFQITVLGYTDAMYIYHPILEGTPLNWFVLGMIFLPYHFVFVSFFDIIRGKK